MWFMLFSPMSCNMQFHNTIPLIRHILDICGLFFICAWLCVVTVNCLIQISDSQNGNINADLQFLDFTNSNKLVMFTTKNISESINYYIYNICVSTSKNKGLKVCYMRLITRILALWIWFVFSALASPFCCTFLTASGLIF